MEQNKFCEGKGRLAIFLILGAVILALVAGIFYYKYKNGVDILTRPNPPKLFSKGDYRVEDRADGKYIVVDKVSLTAKVPTTWRVEFEGNDLPDGTSQYWVNLLSLDAEKKSSLLMNGCGITITLGYEEENNKDLNKQILAIQNNNQDDNLFRTGYQYEIFSVGKNKGVKWAEKENNTFGKNVGLDIPLRSTQTIGFSSIFPVKNAVICENNWEDFIKNIVIK